MLLPSLPTSSSLLWRRRKRESAQRHQPEAWCRIVFGSQLASTTLLSAQFRVVAVPNYDWILPRMNVTEISFLTFRRGRRGGYRRTNAGYLTLIEATRQGVAGGLEVEGPGLRWIFEHLP